MRPTSPKPLTTPSEPLSPTKNAQALTLSPKVRCADRISWLGFYERFTGLEQLAAPRTQGPDGHDQRGKWLPSVPITAPDGLGILAEFEFAKSETTKPLKVTCPGPFTLSGRIQTGGIYKERPRSRLRVCRGYQYGTPAARCSRRGIHPVR